METERQGQRAATPSLSRRGVGFSVTTGSNRKRKAKATTRAERATSPGAKIGSSKGKQLTAMKYLGIDYGSKRIGVAVSDETATLAFPLGIVAAGDEALEEVLALAHENEVKTIVMGESRNFKGEANPIMRHVEMFKAALEGKGMVVIFEPEFMTSAEAAHQHEHVNDGRPSRKEAVAKEFLDSSAAALILQSYLDRIKSSTEVE